MIPDPLTALGGRRIGAHLALGHGMVKAADRARAIGATALQVFSDNPTAWQRKAALPRELAVFRERLAASDITPLATHAAYLINLAGPEADFWQRSVDVLTAELRMAAAYGARYVNLHVGSHRGAGVEIGRGRLVEGVVRAFEAEAASAGDGPDMGAPPPPPMVVLEDAAGAGDAMGTTIPELADILEALDAAGVPQERIGICFDTAHLWGAGHDLARPEGVDAVLAEADARFGLGRLAMMHLNDSRAGLGSRTDRHEHIGAGRIGALGLGHLVRHPSLISVPMFLETPGMDEGYDLINMDRVRALVAGDQLDALPPEAFTLRGSRAPAGPAEA